jgi:hypothetical protein
MRVRHNKPDIRSARSPWRRAFAAVFALCLMPLALALPAGPAWAQQTVRVGVYENSPKVALSRAGKPEGIHLMIGRRPVAPFGNSTGDRQMLEYTKAGSGARLSMLVLHDDAKREYAYVPSKGLPDSKVGTFTQQLYDESKKQGWVVISMKDDWKKIFAFD